MTLTEVMVVLLIIAVLMGLILGGVSKMKESAKESHARMLLTGLLGCSGMYEIATTKVIEHIRNTTYMPWTGTRKMNAPGVKYEGKTGTLVQSDGDDIAADGNDYNDDDGTYTNAMNDTDMERANLYIERFIWAANQMPTVRKTLPSIGAGFGDIELDINSVPAGDGFLEVVDPWGNSVAYAAAVSHDPGKFPDDDFLPEHDSPFFASAGKDQRWGRPMKRGDFTSDLAWKNYKNTDEYRFTLDNLYSFDLDRSAAMRED